MKHSKPSKDYVINDLYSLCGKPGLTSLSADLKSFFEEHPLVVDLLGHAATFLFLIDFAKMEYIYVSDGIVNIMGYTAEEWKKEGIQAAFRTLHPEDKLRLKKLHEDMFQFHFSVPLAERKSYQYIFDFRVIRRDGKVIWLLSQASFIALDEKGNAAIGFETCSDITHIKKDNTMTLSITKTSKGGKDRIENKFYYPLEGTDCFTVREIQILQHLYRGLTSKQIADTLAISELTVSKHRNNMMKKTNTTNGAGLVNYALKNKLL